MEKIDKLSSCHTVTNETIQSVDATKNAKDADCNNSCVATCGGTCAGDSGYTEWFRKKYGYVSQTVFCEHIEKYFYDFCAENEIEVDKEKMYCQDGSESSVFYKMVLKKRKTKQFVLGRRSIQSIQVQQVYHPDAEGIYRMFALVIKYFKIEETVYKSYFDNGRCIEFDKNECLKTIDWFKTMNLTTAIDKACVHEGQVYVVDVNPPHA